MAYDPRISYKPRVDSTGTVDTSGSTSVSAGGVVTSTNTFYVYFYKNSSTNLNEVWNGKISNSSGVDQYWSTTNANYNYAPHLSPLQSAAYFTSKITQIQFGSAAAAQLITGATPGLDYPNAVDGTQLTFPRFVGRTDCNAGAATGGSCSLAEERLNYATWKKYHSSRLDVVKTGLGWAFDQFGPTLRLGWGTIFDMSGGSLNTGANLLTPSHKLLFYNWLYGKSVTWNGTPNLAAVETMGKYFSRADNKGPWANTPNASSVCTNSTTCGTVAGETSANRKNHFSCRRSYGMLITDGYYDGTTSVGDVDSTAHTTVNGSAADGTALTYTYNGTTKPYPGGGSNTIADIAMKYWVTDLRPGLSSDNSDNGIDNQVKKIDDTVVSGIITSRGNESFWQNMSFYGVGLGVVGTLDQTEGVAGSVLENIRNNVANTNNSGSSVTGWPTAATFQEESIDDLWHATINGRGRMLSAKNADTLSDGVEGMLASINKMTDSQSGVAASTASLITGTRKYSPLYTTGTWVGNIIATNLDVNSAVDTCIAWQVSGAAITGPNVAPACAGFTTNSIPTPHTNRKIYAWENTAFGDFTASNTYVQSNVVGGSNANLINYLRGDQSNEDTATTTNLYRTRTSLLGDIVNSTPTFIQGALDMGYSNLPTGANGQANYAAFVTAKAARTEGVLFAGANDGMLHGFRDSTGAEVFAFVPRAVMPQLHKLSARSYNHQYYVDGTTVEADACLGTSGQANKNCSVTEWRNLLLGSLGAGGKSVFAIDVTTLTPSPTMGLSATNILWEITTSTTGYANLGNTFGDVQTGVTTGGQWVAVFGNGYYGADGIAHLYIADLATGALLKDISTTVGSSNGLSTPTLVRDSNQRIIGAYAGDLKGNMWKFDLSASTAADWALGLTGAALFAPTSGKPITAPPAIVTHPNGGRVVTFGTGKFFDKEDTVAGSTQSFYGVWDSVAFGYPMPATPSGVVQTGVANLVQQTVSAGVTGTYVATNANLTTQTVTFTGYTQSKNTVDWTTKRGWYMNMPFTGERLVFPMASLFSTGSTTSRLVMANTLAPTASVDPCLTTQSGQGWSYVFDLLTGSRPDSSIYPNCVDCSMTPTPPVPPVVICNTSKCFALTPTEPGCTVNCSAPPIEKFCGAQTGIACPPSSSTVKRTWRQLFMR
jgi:type IV pilus assembly protein PilY1